MSNKTKNFSGISLLRAIAALGIMLYHIGFGQNYLKSINLSAGIHIFFCISAFLVMYSTQKKTAGIFIIGRLTRIIPLYLIITVATFAAAKILPSFWSDDITLKELIYSVFLIPHAREGLTGDNIIRPILGPGWTLYYVIWFALLFTAAMKLKHKARGWISATACIIAYIAALIIPGNFAVLRLLRTGFILDFAAGIAIFELWKKYLNIWVGV
jgi:exopolysaccharide production protein ExoZ